MKDEKDLQSRRSFFKNAAKAALPIIGAITLVNMPFLAKGASGNSAGCTYCQGGCYGCTGTCVGNCTDACTGCSGLCQGTCKGMCYNSAS